MKRKWPKLPCYLIPLYECATIYFCRSRDEWNQACNAINVEPGCINFLSGCTARFVSIERQENIYLLGVFNNDTGTLAHECAHLAFYACGDVGVPVIAGEANEPYCYLLDKIFTHFLPFMAESSKQ